MLFKEMLDEEKAEGRAEGRIEGRAEGKAEGKAEAILDLLSDFGMIPDKLREKILQEKDLDILCSYLKKAAASKSIEEFETLIKN